MHINYVEDIREEFRRLKASGSFRGPTIEIQNAFFKVDSPTIFGSRNEEYIKAEMEWYESQSLSVHDLFDIYGKEVQIWMRTCGRNGMINSNYGWCIYNPSNGHQYTNVRRELERAPDSRRAVMYYTRPSMHIDQNKDSRNDHMCTTHVQYFINNNYLEAQVNMRSNDAIFGFINDYAWQHHVLLKLAKDLNLQPGAITWSAGSLHVYERHYDLII